MEFIYTLSDDKERIEHQVILSSLTDIYHDIELPNTLIPYISTQMDKTFGRKDTDEDGDDVFNLKMEIDYTAESETQYAIKDMIDQGDARTAFHDKDIGFFINTIYQSKDFNLTAKVSSKSKSKIKEVIANITKLIKTDQSTNKHKIVFDYYIDEKLTPLLNVLLEYKNKVLSEKLTLDNYLLGGANIPITRTGNHLGQLDKSLFTFNESYNNIIGNYKTAISDLKEEFDTEKNVHSITFEYRFSAEVPEYLYFSYPEVINNQVLPRDFITKVVDENDDDCEEAVFRGESTAYNELLYNFKKDTSLSVLTVPRYDAGNLNDVSEVYIPIAYLLCGITNEDKRNLFNITDIPGIVFNDEVIQYMKDNHELLNHTFKSLFQIKLFKDNKLTADTDIEVTKDLLVRATIDLDITSVYRVSIRLISNTAYLGTGAQERLKENNPMVDTLFNFITVDDAYYCTNEVVTKKKIINGSYKIPKMNVLHYVLAKSYLIK